MPIIQIINDQVVVSSGGATLNIDLLRYNDKHKPEVLRALRAQYNTNELKCLNITDEKIMDAIIHLLSTNTFNSIEIDHSHFRPMQIQVLLSNTRGTVNFDFYSVSVEVGDIDVVEIVEHSIVNDLVFLTCDHAFVSHVLSIIRPQRIRTLSVWEHDPINMNPNPAPLNPVTLSRFIGSCQEIKKFNTDIDILALFRPIVERNDPVIIQELTFDFDWISNPETSIRFADVMYRLYDRGLTSFKNEFNPQPLGFEVISDRLRVFAARTLNRMSPMNFRTYESSRLTPELRDKLQVEQARISALPYGQMMVILFAADQGIGILDTLPPELFRDHLSKMLGTS